MVLAHMAGIKVFVSGGLGGVHRGGELTMDISADLTEFSRTPIAVVTSGEMAPPIVSLRMQYEIGIDDSSLD